MSACFIVVMRMTSTRLPQKPFTVIKDSSVVDRIIQNLMAYGEASGLVFAISDHEADDALANYLQFKGLSVFRGSQDNVLKRFKEASETVKADWYIRYNGDNVFHCPENFQAFSKVKDLQNVKVVTNTKPRSLPKGITFEAVRADVLNQLDPDDYSDYDKEHIFPAIYRHVEENELFNITFDAIKTEQNLSLDYVKDSLFLQSRMQDKYMYASKDIGELIIERTAFETDNPFLGKNGVFTIAEIGGNHQGNFEYAVDLVSQAISTDVDSIKLQIYTPDLIVNPMVDPERNKHFSNFALEPAQYISLLEMIKLSGKKAMASVWSVEELETYATYLDYVKVGSGDFNDKTILKKISAIGKPIVISAGLSDETEVVSVYNYLKSQGVRAGSICVLQCTSMYPIPLSEANLNVIPRWKSILNGATIGYSDHTVGETALMSSVSMGAQVLEFHFTDDKHNKAFRDHLVSLEKKDVSDLVSWIRANYILGGDAIKRVTHSELSSRHNNSFRKALYPSKKLTKGHVIQPEDLISLRPECGWPAYQLNDLIGKKLLREKNKYDPINPTDVV